MGKEIQLYSQDNKYMCSIELADSKDRFGCPDHSRIMLFEKREDKIYLIAEARDIKLETEKDKRIAKLKQQLAEKQNAIDEINKEFAQAIHDWKVLCVEKDKEIEKLKQQYTILENENGKLTTELIMDKYKKTQTGYAHIADTTTGKPARK